MYEYKALFLRVIDADTLRLRIDLGFNTFREENVRLARINAPELGTPAGRQAKQFVWSCFETDTVKIRTMKDRKDKYGRYLAEVEVEYYEGQTSNLSDLLIQLGYAAPYEA
ncbi:thermonuclease family protein (plasmid) [Paenibacillus sp. S-38]|uniref:thermonuclease family protein n=1 Tax=Paenibacillus sp. S-38 TaxID=3416710 RepID=UPI003CE80FBD